MGPLFRTGRLTADRSGLQQTGKEMVAEKDFLAKGIEEKVGWPARNRKAFSIAKWDTRSTEIISDACTGLPVGPCTDQEGILVMVSVCRDDSFVLRQQDAWKRLHPLGKKVRPGDGKSRSRSSRTGTKNWNQRLDPKMDTRENICEGVGTVPHVLPLVPRKNPLPRPSMDIV